MSELRPVPPRQVLIEARLRGHAGSLPVKFAFELCSSWTVLFGPSGAGKSTVLRALCGLSDLQEQHVVLQEANLTGVPAHRRRIAMVSQNTALFPHMTALENILFSIRVRGGFSRTDGAAEARRVLERFHVSDAAEKSPARLSGGERQRVALARAVASRPRLLLLDEAFTGLQTDLRTELVEEVKGWQRDTGVPVISVTHDVAEALGSADEVVKIDQGRTIAQGRPEDVLANERETLLQQLR